MHHNKIILGVCFVVLGISLIVITWFSDSYSLFSTSSNATGSITVPENNSAK